ncbi:hypothetical protein IQ264_28400 [Phormidium sp. LEGE 05292]|uniref:hormogonium polysaccharide biosynthesis protein HpsA n=1 Tax=[Phormidium] sp. LEGE 05292 TaxID=767427 RepID=UPI00187E81F7|nr:hormogonium polysaccharide biosynthesis protein HpsA [Phormidium sp. LEGE 05292]MBE9229331.1 hypothetical protein [Phormidium sp. LEGE 05292]
MLRRKHIRAIKRAFHKLFKRTWNWINTVTKSLFDWFLRTVLLIGVNKQRQPHAKAGFVLPTVVLLLLVVTLVVAAILLRTQSRTIQVMGSREEQVIYNAATPAIERAKAKLEYLFAQDTRIPTGAASDQLLLQILANDDSLYSLVQKASPDPYTFGTQNQPGSEKRIDLNGDGNPNNDPAWSYETDVDNDGKLETVVYGIYLRSRDDTQQISIDGIGGRDSNGIAVDKDGSDTDAKKAKALVTRNGPISTINLNDTVCASLTNNPTPPPPNSFNSVDESVWYPSGSGVLRKTFQVDAIVVSSKQGTSRTVATLEFQQDRQLDRANRWGAWFRYDMEIYPGAGFNWNGAMYSAGNLFIGSDNTFRAYLISAPKSCFYGKDSSEITVLEEPTPSGGTPQYQGQFKAAGAHNNSAGSAQIDLQLPGGNNTDPDKSKTNVVPAILNDGSDSVGGKSASDVAIDPVILFTQDLSRAKGGNPLNRDPARDSSWSSKSFVTQGRFRNQLQNPPYVDDTYRADNRWGPKPKYDRVDSELALNNADRYNGKPIASTPISPTKIDKLIGNTTNTVSDPDYRLLGLDGYWERRAWANGLRVIVSPRLQLGNTFGWVNSDLNGNGNRNDVGETDPLYPVNKNGTSHEQQQRRTLRDNLAAVQATVVYHHDSGAPSPAGDTPLACVATTAHPGTQTTDWDSRNFMLPGQKYWYPTQPAALVSDFFYGRGTNGWEFTVPALSEFTGGTPLRTALQNLAKFAGDYTDVNNSGAFPPTQGGRVYPNPYLTMWGNFSNLKRALALPANNSIADNSYLHTAGCAVGMLAYNLNYFLQSPNYDNSWWASTPASFTTVSTALESATNPVTWPTTGYTPTPDDYIAKLTGDNQRLARFVHMKEQIIRDRRFGFSDSPTTANFFKYTINQQTDTPGTPPTTGSFSYAGKTYTNGQTVNIGCDFSSTGNNFFGISTTNSGPTNTYAANVTVPSGADNEKRFIILATSLCNTKPKFPSLYYLFPTAANNNHDRISAPVGATLPTSEPYLDASLTNNSEQFTAVEPTAITSVQPKGENWTSGNNSANGNWYLPTSDQINPASPLENDFGIITRNAPSSATAPNRYTSLIDTAFFDSREKMTVRALTLDLNLLRRNTIGSNTWLPKSGIVYAFREDAVREDTIARPASGTSPNNNTNPTSPTDPLLETNGLTRKPVDFKPDPDRRPYGFRLRNGQDLRRYPNGILDENNPRGITFVSDNPIYIQGDFNYHSTNGTSSNLIEEFSDKKIFNSGAAPDWGSFYTRSTLDTNFGRTGSGKDTWRPAEILSDAITILSNNFHKGYIDLGITQDVSNAQVTSRYSFLAINGPTTPTSGNGWLLEDGTVRTTSSTLPIKLSRDGHPMFCNVAPTNGFCPVASQTPYNSTYRALDADYRTNVNQATETRVNSIIVSGITPTGLNQPNGGFHNFPRFIENWSSTSALISGSFVQLNFSTYATAPYTQNSVIWEPANTNPGGAGNVQYYQPPNRYWGYDVGLQYAPAGPMSQRFVTSGKKRSEFYRDLKVDDPYICRLRLALNKSNGLLDPASLKECL